MGKIPSISENLLASYFGHAHLWWRYLTKILSHGIISFLANIGITSNPNPDPNSCPNPSLIPSCGLSTLNKDNRFTKNAVATFTPSRKNSWSAIFTPMI